MYKIRILFLGIALAISGCGESPDTPRDIAEALRHKEFGSAKRVFDRPEVARLAQAACFGESLHIASAIKKGVDPNAQGASWNEGGSANRITPLLWAMDCNSEQGVEALLKAGARPNYRPPDSTDSRTPVHFAAGLDNTNILRLALRFHGDPNAGFPNDPQWALQAAFDLGVKTGNWNNYYLLLEVGADINREYGDETIAEHAVLRGIYDNGSHYDRVLDLLKRGYTHDLVNLASEMNTSWICRPLPPLSAAQQRAKEEVIDVLKERGVKFPVLPPVDRISGTVSLEEDKSLFVWWRGQLKCGKPILTKFQAIKPNDPAYAVVLKRVGGLRPYQTKDMLRQPSDPLP